MNKTLVVFTHKYPYEPPTEQFFHNELKYLQQKFNKIILVPTSREINRKNKYIIDDNIIVCSVKRKSKILEFFFGITLNTVVNKKYWIEIIDLFKHKDSKIIENLIELTTSYIRGGMLCYQLKHRLIKVIDKDKNIILYSYWLNNNAIIAADFKKYLLRKKKIDVQAIARAHGHGDLYVKYRPQIRTINESIDKIYSISEKGKDFLLESRLNSNIIEVSRLGVNEQSLSDKKGKEFIIVSCSVLNANKRVDRIISSLSLIDEEFVTWVHFGDGNLMQNIKNLSRERLPKNIKWELKGKTPNEEIIDFYANERPTLFINVSSIEGVPVSIMEAMSCGIPVIATDVGATSEIVDHMENGFLLKEEFDDKELAQLIRYVYHNNNEIENMSRKAFNKWRTYYNADINYKAFADSCHNLSECINEKGVVYDDRK